MEQVKIFHDWTGNTLTVWFGNPQEEYVCEETGGGHSDERPDRPCDRV